MGRSLDRSRTFRVAQVSNLLLQVFLNPPAELADMPLKSFYRYSLPDISGVRPL